MEASLRRRRSLAKRLLTAAILITAVAAILFILISANILPALRALGTARMKAISTHAMNDAILESMGESEEYLQLIERFENGNRVYLLQADTRGMNLLAASCAKAAQDRVTKLGEQGISVPVGTASGIPIFSGKGPQIRIFFTPAGSVTSEFESEFVSSGINQTLYRVKLRMTASLKLVMAGVSETVTVQAEAAIAENVIVGDVPQVYTNVASEEDMLNLIPTDVQ